MLLPLLLLVGVTATVTVVEDAPMLLLLLLLSMVGTAFDVWAMQMANINMVKLMDP